MGGILSVRKGKYAVEPNKNPIKLEEITYLN
jgi:hypothetical protein